MAPVAVVDEEPPALAELLGVDAMDFEMAKEADVV
jgi:hypothetical protein